MTHHPTDTDAASRLQRENDYLAERLAAIEMRMPSPEDLAYLQRKRAEDDRAAWAWQVIRKYAPSIVIVATMIGSGITWVATHSINISAKP